MWIIYLVSGLKWFLYFFPFGTSSRFDPPIFVKHGFTIIHVASEAFLHIFRTFQRWNLFSRMWTWAKLTSDALLFLGDISIHIPGTQNKQFKNVYFGDFQPCRELFHHLNQPLINVWSSQVRSNQSQKIWQSINVNGTLPSSLGKHKKLPFF